MSYTWLVSNVLFPLHERLKGHGSVAKLGELERTQWWAPAELEALQLRRLRDLLSHASAHVPYYERLWGQTGIRPERVTALADLQRLPLLSKADIRSSQQELRSEMAGALKRYNTGGSTGEPLIFFMGRDRIAHDVAAKWRATRWWGVDIGDPEIVIWGSPIEVNKQDYLKTLRDRVLRTHLLPAFEMSERNLGRFVREIRRVRPRMVFGYPSALAHIAAYADHHGLRMDDLGIKVAFVTAERLYDHQRATIEHTFGCRVANGYGGRDAGFIAHACREQSMHVSEDIIVETVNAEGIQVPAGQAGEIVVTHLATRDFPFIRYRTGDVGVLSHQPCECGRGLAVLAEVQGRSTDFVVALDGTVMHGLALIYVLRSLPGISQFKIIQESIDRTVVQVVCSTMDFERVSGSIQDGIRARLGAGVDVKVELATQLSAERSGKFRYVVSHVPLPGPSRVASPATT